MTFSTILNRSDIFVLFNWNIRITFLILSVMLVVDLSYWFFLSFIVLLLLLINHWVNLSFYMYMGLGPSSGHGQCARSHVLKGKCHYLPPQPSAVLFLLSSVGTWRPLPHSYHNVNLLDLIQLCAGKYSCCGLRHVVTINMLQVSISSSSVSSYITSAHSSVIFPWVLYWRKLLQVIHSQLSTHSLFCLALWLHTGLCHSHYLLQNLCFYCLSSWVSCGWFHNLNV